MDNGLIDIKGRVRCWWCGHDPDYQDYHDLEWGRPEEDDRRLFEKICLEGFQAGLSWLTILRKRPSFRAAFLDFDFERVARFDGEQVERLLLDPGIVRHRKKIEATIHNAQRACELVEEQGSLRSYFWRFEPPSRAQPQNRGDVSSQTPASAALSKDLKKRGWRFVGATTAYAFMQAMGLVNDHLQGCDVGPAVEAEHRRFRSRFPQPGG
ncbi:MAG: DNA-3-methyladenine glycosylase I [Myxococcota bacterium]